MAVGLLASMMDVPPSSRASPLPHRFLVVDKISVHRRSLLGAKLARDSGGSACIDVGCAGLFAGKPAPTLDLQWARNLCSAQFPLWEQSLLAMAVGLLASMMDVPPSRASSLPHRFLVVYKISVHRRSLWGAKLARDSGESACIDVGCAGLFAGKPAPTLDLQWARNLCSAQFPLWEQARLPKVRLKQI